MEIIECDPSAGGNETIALVDATAPDVVLLDVGYPARDGLHLCRRIRNNFLQIKVVMLTTNPIEDNDALFEAIKSGAAAYLMTQKCSSAELIATIERASRGEYPIDDNASNNPEVALRVLRELQEVLTNIRTEDDIITPLNQQEVEILTLVANGKANKEVADILGMSESGTKQKVSNILRKLNANNRAHAVVLAMRSGLFFAQPDISMGRRRGDILVEASDAVRVDSN